LFSWLIAMLIWAPAGLWMLEKLKATLHERPVHNFILAAIVGAALNATVLGLVSLWMPVSVYTSMVLMLVSTVLLSRTYRNAITRIYGEMKTWSVLGWTAL